VERSETPGPPKSAEGARLSSADRQGSGNQNFATSIIDPKRATETVALQSGLGTHSTFLGRGY
jgi:hypothetical protein